MAIIRICDICKSSFLDKKESHIELRFSKELPFVLLFPDEQELDLCMACYTRIKNFIDSISVAYKGGPHEKL